jgi:hypothetical protein
MRRSKTNAVKSKRRRRRRRRRRRCWSTSSSVFEDEGLECIHDYNQRTLDVL